jgi:hypothetical protein
MKEAKINFFSIFLIGILTSVVFTVVEGEFKYPYRALTDRDPMYPLVNERGEILIKEKKVVGDLIIQGIIYSPPESVVVINNEMYQEGDDFEEYKIKKIEPNGIIFQKNSEEYFLKWEE